MMTALFPQPPIDHRRSASTSTSQTDWLTWLKTTALQKKEQDGSKALLFAGLVSLYHFVSTDRRAHTHIHHQHRPQRV